MGRVLRGEPLRVHLLKRASPSAVVWFLVDPAAAYPSDFRRRGKRIASLRPVS